jgi:alpha,alpha-trehalase
LLCGLLDHRAGGAFTVAPDRVAASAERYEQDTGVLVTELHGPDAWSS